MVRSPLWLAVDTADASHARDLVRSCAASLGGVKLGLEFFVANGPEGVRAVMADTGLPLFLDLKFHDIPNTVAKAVASASALNPALLTIHVSGGVAMIHAAKAAAGPDTKVIAVTVLTSLDAEDLHATGVGATPLVQVQRLALLARDAGADGVVCSPREVTAAKALWPGGCFVVPGVRPAGSEAGDQKRIMTPKEALRAGAWALVVGRPITAAPDPAAAARELLAGC
ncbi:MAG: orotidine-5'-phosphate decarboxylase [Sphingomonadaceae bacterium]